MNINNDNREYDIVTENQLATILAQFDSAYIFSVISDNLQMKYSDIFVDVMKPNVIGSFEISFKNLKEIYKMDMENIEATRQEVYDEVIRILCNEYHLALSPNYESLTDKYTLAYYLYDLLVSNFSNNITSFFTRYIVQEKENIYNMFNLENLKKNKDSSTIYGKKTYNDTKLAIINANLVSVLNEIQAFDINFTDICRTIYPNAGLVSLITSMVYPSEDFYKTYYCEVFRNPEIAPMFVTNIRLEIQKNQ